MGLYQNEVSCIIAAGQSLSPAVFLGAGTAARIRMPPSVWTAAAISFRTSFDGVLYQPLCDSAGVEISYTVAAGTDVLCPALDGITYLKIQSGTSGAAVAQVAAGVLSIITNRRTVK